MKHVLVFMSLALLAGAQQGPNYPPRTIDMPIDHYPQSARYEPHTNETFKQRYFFDSSFYKPGGPVFLYIGGETSGESRFENLQNGIIYVLMQATNGLGVILENRYYGESFPFENSTVDNLAYLTTEQTIADNAYFAQHATFDGIEQDVTAPSTPWILYGGSLAGAQVAFSIKTYGDILWAGIASSGVIKAKLGYPEWYSPIQKFAPQDCVTSINRIVDQMDTVISSGNTEAIAKLQTIFGLESLPDIRDFAATVAFPLGGPMYYPTNTWQELNWWPAYGSNDFFEFCSNVTNAYAPHDVRQVDYELSQYTGGKPWKNLGNYANYVKTVVLPICSSGKYNSPHCFGTQHPNFWARTANDENRSYLYTCCAEQGSYLAAPEHGPYLISRVLQVNYTQQWCEWAFAPGTYNSIPKSPELVWYNKYGGLKFKAKRLAFVDGTIDPWLDLCYHSNDAPPRYSSRLHPELLIAGAGHHWDSYGIKNVSAEPPFIQQAHLFEIRTVQKWLQEFGRSSSEV